MKVADFYQKNPVTLREDKPVRDAVRLIFNLGVSAILVMNDKNKLTGIITETDILARLFPTIKDFMEDFLGSRDFEAMEIRLKELLNKPVSTLMTKKIKSIKPETLLMNAQSMMLVNNFSHLPVVDADGNLAGIISQGDIFKALAGKEVPYDIEADYYDWMSYYYNFVSQKQKRYLMETEELGRIFRENKIQKIVDIGCGMGMHSMDLVKKGFDCTGIERSQKLTKMAGRERDKLSQEYRARLEFMDGDYKDVLSKLKKSFGAAIFMGNVLSHIYNNYEEVLRQTFNALFEEHVLIVVQLTNFEKLLNVTGGFQDFNISPFKDNKNKRYAFLQFYERDYQRQDMLLLTMSVALFNGRRWSMAGINSTPVAYITKEKIEALMKKTGFKDISFYGSCYGEPILARKPDLKKDDWITVVAKK